MILLIAFESIADILAKKWSEGNALWRAIAALAGYLICNTFRLFSLKNGVGLGRWAIIFSVASGVLAVLIGVFLFREHITALQMTGIVIGLVSIALLSI